MRIGAQLYTVREHMKNLDDFSETLKKIADIGYEIVQVSGACDYEPEWLRDQLKQNGLQCAVTHVNVAKLQSDPAKMAADHKIFGCRYIGMGATTNALHNGESDYQAFSDLVHEIGPVLHANDCQLMIHNHNFEFARASKEMPIYLERMMQDFSPEELGFTLDTYWVQAGGGDSAYWLRRLKGRVACVHLKDMSIVDGKQQMAPIYEGNMNFDEILKACEDAGAQYLLVEQDDCYGEDPFDCLKRSYKNLIAKGLK